MITVPACQRGVTAIRVSGGSVPLMRELPEELRDAFEEMSDRLTEEMLLSWKNGLCDGLEWAARAAETILGKLKDGSPEREVVLGLALGIRHAEMKILLDGLEDEGDNAG